MSLSNKPHNAMRAGFWICVFVFVFSVHCYTLQGIPVGGDSLGMFLVAHSISARGTVFPEPALGVFWHRGPGGRAVSKFAIGQSIAELPLLFVAGRFAGPFKSTDPADARKLAVAYFIDAFTSPVLILLALLAAFAWMGRMGFTDSQRLAAVLCLAFGSLLWSTSKVLMSESLQTAALATAAWALMRFRERGAAVHAVAASCAIAVAFLAKPVLLFMLPIALVYLLWPGARARYKPSAWVAAAIPLVAAFALAAWYNQIRFGGALNFGYYTENNRDSLFRFNVPFWMGLFGLLFSSGKGLFFYCPFIIISIAGWPRFHRARPAESALCAMTVLAFLFAFAKWNQWHGDFAWGPRFLAPMAPFLAPQIKYFLEEGARSLRVAVAAFFIFLSVAVQILGVSVNFNEYLVMELNDGPRQIFIRPGAPDIRDELPNAHFIPQFSPIAGHAWLLRHTIADRSLPIAARNERMRRDFPWRSMIPYASPSQPARAAGWDFWKSNFMKYYGGEPSWFRRLDTALRAVLAVSLLCALGFAAGIYRSGATRKPAAPL